MGHKKTTREAKPWLSGRLGELADLKLHVSRASCYIYLSTRLPAIIFSSPVLCCNALFLPLINPRAQTKVEIEYSPYISEVHCFWQEVNVITSLIYLRVLRLPFVQVHLAIWHSPAWSTWDVTHKQHRYLHGHVCRLYLCEDWNRRFIWISIQSFYSY